MNPMHIRLTKLLTCAVVMLAAGGLSSAAEFFLRADETTITMPDGRVVPMWGFALDSAFGVDDGTVTVPGPMLTVPEGDTTLTIHLWNKLPEGNPVSIVIPGQRAAMTPVRHAALSIYAGRVRSFTAETEPDNETVVSYTWTNFRPGTFLYHSGSHPACQVQMGLYGCVKKDYAAGEAYDGVAYDREVVLLTSEVDPEFHDAVSDGDFGPGKPVTSTTHYRPKYFLVNGAPYTSSALPLAAGAAGERVLVRFLNAGILSHAFLLQGLYMQTLAEDGFAYRHPRQRYCLHMPPLKTTDVLITSPDSGTFALYDRTLRLTNDLDAPGGLLTFLEFAD